MFLCQLTHSPLKTQLNSSNSKVGIVHYEISGMNELNIAVFFYKELAIINES